VEHHLNASLMGPHIRTLHHVQAAAMGLLSSICAGQDAHEHVALQQARMFVESIVPAGGGSGGAGASAAAAAGVDKDRKNAARVLHFLLNTAYELGVRADDDAFATCIQFLSAIDISLNSRRLDSPHIFGRVAGFFSGGVELGRGIDGPLISLENAKALGKRIDAELLTSPVPPFLPVMWYGGAVHIRHHPALTKAIIEAAVTVLGGLTPKEVLATLTVLPDGAVRVTPSLRAFLKDVRGRMHRNAAYAGQLVAIDELVVATSLDEFDRHGAAAIVWSPPPGAPAPDTAAATAATAAAAGAGAPPAAAAGGGDPPAAAGAGRGAGAKDEDPTGRFADTGLADHTAASLLVKQHAADGNDRKTPARRLRRIN